MDIRELTYIYEIGRTRHMIRAAENLYITQPALHKALRKVEHELDTQLFFRRGNQLLPTDTGRIVLETAESIMGQMARMNDAVLAVKNLKRGSVTIGFPSVVGSMYLPQLLIEFQRRYPDISLSTVEAGGMELMDLVLAGELDMAIVMRPVHSDALNEIPLVSDQVVAALPTGHPLAEQSYVTVRDLAGVPFNTFDRTFNMSSQLFERFRQEDVQPTVEFSGASCQMLYDMSVLSGNPLILPEPIVDFYARGRLRLLPFKPAFPWELCLIFPKNAFLSIASKALIGHIQEFLFKNGEKPFPSGYTHRAPSVD